MYKYLDDELRQSRKEALDAMWKREREKKRWYKLPKWVIRLSGIIVACAVIYVIVVLWMAL